MTDQAHAPNIVNLADARREKQIDEFERLMNNDPPLANTVEVFGYEMDLSIQACGYQTPDGTMGIAANIQFKAIIDGESYHAGLLRMSYEQWEQLKAIGDDVFNEISTAMTEKE